MIDTVYPTEAAALGIVPPGERVSVGACIRRGLLRVNGPVMAVMATAWAIVFVPLKAGWLPDHVPFPPSVNLAIGLGFVLYCVLGPPLIAWVWWSSTVSQWRIWTLQHVDDWPRA